MVSSSFEELAATYSRLNYPITIELPHRERTFGWRGHFAQVGDVAVAAYEARGGLIATSDNAAPLAVLTFPIGVTSAVTCSGRNRYELVPEKSGTIVAPGVPGNVRQEPGYQCLNVAFKQQDVDRAFAVLTGKLPRTSVRFNGLFSLTTHSSQVFLRLLHVLISELEALDLAPPVRERFGEALTFQLLHAQPHNHSALLSAPAPPATSLQVRRVADYLESELQQPIRMSDLTRLTGTSARSIQAGFKKQHGCTPIEFLRARRLDRAHTLLGCDDGSSVVDIAQRCGFHHPGRFSGYYRDRFGETPAQTRAKRRQSSRP